MSVVVSMEDLGPCRKQLTVEVPAPAVEAETERIIVELSRSVRLPGFRRGKVPRRLVQQRFREDIEREVIDRLVPRYWRQAEAESQLKPILQPQVSNVDLQEGAPLTFVATVEIRPEVELGDLGSFDLPQVEVDPTPEEVDEALEKLRISVADWVPVDRAAAVGDLVSAELTEEGEDGPGESRNVQVELGGPGVGEQLTLTLTGMKEGQETRFVHRPETGGESAPREQEFQVKVIAVKERELPPVDDSLAAQLGDFDNLEALRTALNDRLTVEKGAERRRRHHQALLQQLRERHPLELPEGVVEREAQLLLHEYAESMGRSGVDLERADIDWERLAQEVKPEAERRVHNRVLLEAVAEAEDLKVSEEEFETMLAAIAKSEKRTTVAVRQSLDKAGKLTALRAQMLQEKAVKHLLGRCQET